MTALLFALVMAAGAQQEPGSVTLKNGTIVTTLKAGTGPTPGPKDLVTVHYKASLPEGAPFDDTHRAGKPVTFKLNELCPCWAEGLQRVRSGGSAKLVCLPSTTGGAPVDAKKVPPNATVVFEVDLLEVAVPK